MFPVFFFCEPYQVQADMFPVFQVYIATMEPAKYRVFKVKLNSTSHHLKQLQLLYLLPTICTSRFIPCLYLPYIYVN
jgi:hypothetical protein